MDTLLFGTPMHFVATCLFVSIETVIFLFLLAYLLVRPDDKKITRSLIVIFLLVICHLTVGLLPDTKLPVSFFIQVLVLLTNIGFLLFFGLQIIKAIRTDHEKSRELEQQLSSSRNVVREKDERIKELKKSNEQERNNYINLFHESNTLSALPFEELKQKIETMLNIIQKQQQEITNISIEVSILKMGMHKETGNMDQTRLSNVMKNCIAYHLTHGEIEVAVLLYSEKSYKDIAEKLNISVNTVRKHMQNITGLKVGVSGRKELMDKLMEEPSNY